MKSFLRTSLICAVFLVPIFASAQLLNGPSTGSFQFTGWQQFSGGTSFIPGGGLGVGGGAFGVGGIAITIINLINFVLVPLLFAVSFIVFLYGVAKSYIFSPGDEAAVKSGHQIILWGLIGFAVMISIWGLVNVVVASFGLAQPFAPPSPSSWSPSMAPPPVIPLPPGQ